MGWSNITEMLLLSDVWSGLAYYFVSLPLFPVFNIVHFILTAAALRNEPGGHLFAFKHPIASCVLTFAVAVSGGILANIALAKPPLECVLNGWNVLACILSWYLIFFSPMDICYTLTFFTPIKLTLLIIEEFARAKKMFAGVTLAASVYPHSMLAMALIGMFKGSGKRWGVTLYRLSYNPQSAGQHELLKISYVTKVAFLFGLVFAYNQTTPLIDPSLMVLLTGIMLATFRLALFFYSNSADPFSLPQNLSWRLMTIFSLTPVQRGLVTDEYSGTKGLKTKPHGPKSTSHENPTKKSKQKSD